MYITAIFAHLIVNCTKTKIYAVHLKLQLTLQPRAKYTKIYNI